MTDTSIMRREAISEQARQAARAWANAPAGAPQPQCPYPRDSDAWKVWNVSLQRWILQYSAPDGTEASA